MKCRFKVQEIIETVEMFGLKAGSEVLHCSPDTLRVFILARGLSVPAKGRHKAKIDEAEFREMYGTHSVWSLARHFKTSQGRIMEFRDSLGLKARPFKKIGIPIKERTH